MSRSNPRIPLTPIEGTPVVTETPAITNPEVSPEVTEAPAEIPAPEAPIEEPAQEQEAPVSEVPTEETEASSEESTPIEEPEVKSEEATPDLEPSEETVKDVSDAILPFEEEVSLFELVPFNTAAIHPEPNVIVLCELDGDKAPKDRSFVKGQWDEHKGVFFTTANYFYEELKVNRWLELK